MMDEGDENRKKLRVVNAEFDENNPWGDNASSIDDKVDQDESSSMSDREFMAMRGELHKPEFLIDNLGEEYKNYVNNLVDKLSRDGFQPAGSPSGSPGGFPDGLPIDTISFDSLIKQNIITDPRKAYYTKAENFLLIIASVSYKTKDVAERFVNKRVEERVEQMIESDPSVHKHIYQQAFDDCMTRIKGYDVEIQKKEHKQTSLQRGLEVYQAKISELNDEAYAIRCDKVLVEREGNLKVKSMLSEQQVSMENKLAAYCFERIVILDKYACLTSEIDSTKKNRTLLRQFVNDIIKEYSELSDVTKID